MPQRSILVVDDDYHTRRAITSLLLPRGYVVHETTTPASAIDLIMSLSLDGIITSYHFDRDMTGIDILKFFNSRCPQAGKILVTVSCTPEVIRLARSVGAVCLTRPLSLSDLLWILETTFRR